MKKLNAYTTYLILIGWDGAISSLIFTVSVIYQVTVVGLDPLQLVLVGTVLEATAFSAKCPPVLSPMCTAASFQSLSAM